MKGRPPSATLTDTVCPFTTLFRCKRRVDLALIAQDLNVERRRGQRERQPDDERRLPGEGGGQQQRSGDGEAAYDDLRARSEEHTSELQSLMRISYAVSCFKKNTTLYQPIKITLKTD